ncbi:MAG: hypothetical protein ACE5NM_00145 [Sedimentisphaerales bacterium]
MKRFVWRLQHVLDIKAKQEQKIRAELLEITEKLAQTQGQLLTQRRILHNIALTIAQNLPRKRLGQQEFFLKYSAESREQIKMLKDQISKLESEQRKKIAEVVKARQFKEGLQSLRAEAKKRFITEQEKLEQKELDEAATVSFARNKVSELVN